MSNNLLEWDRKETDQFEPGWFIGSDGDQGEHLRDQGGWPFSVYRKAKALGATDMVLCHGIQDLRDATILAALINDRA